MRANSLALRLFLWATGCTVVILIITGIALVATRYVVQQADGLTVAMLRYCVATACLLPMAMIFYWVRVAKKDFFVIAALVAALKEPKERVAAATALLDRGYGRPQQTHAFR